MSTIENVTNFKHFVDGAVKQGVRDYKSGITEPPKDRGRDYVYYWHLGQKTAEQRLNEMM